MGSVGLEIGGTIPFTNYATSLPLTPLFLTTDSDPFFVDVLQIFAQLFLKIR